MHLLHKQVQIFHLPYTYLGQIKQNKHLFSLFLLLSAGQRRYDIIFIELKLRERTRVSAFKPTNHSMPYKPSNPNQLYISPVWHSHKSDNFLCIPINNLQLQKDLTQERLSWSLVHVLSHQICVCVTGK